MAGSYLFGSNTPGIVDPGADTALNNQANAMYDQARQMRTSIPQQAKDINAIGGAQGRKGLAQSLAGIKTGAQARGLLYSGLRQGAESGAYTDLANNLAQQSVQTNQNLENQAYGAETDALSGLEASRDAEMDRQQNLYQQALSNKQLQSAADSRLFGLSGTLRKTFG